MNRKKACCTITVLILFMLSLCVFASEDVRKKESEDVGIFDRFAAACSWQASVV